MVEIIDLSQTLYEGMPVHHSLPQMRMRIHATHEEWEGLSVESQTPSVYALEMSEHTGTHVDAINHMGKAYAEQSIDQMPLSMFYTAGICLDFSHKGLSELIHTEEIADELEKKNLEIREGDTVLFCTQHFKRHYGTAQWPMGPGLTEDAARWLGMQKIAAFGVETMSPGVSGVSNKAVHRVCGELGFTHYENLINLERLLGRGRFRFIAFPLKIRGGTGSPVRAVAVFE